MYVGRYLDDKARGTVFLNGGGDGVTWALSVGSVFMSQVMLFFSCIGRQCHFGIRSNLRRGGVIASGYHKSLRSFPGGGHTNLTQNSKNRNPIVTFSFSLSLFLSFYFAS